MEQICAAEQESRSMQAEARQEAEALCRAAREEGRKGLEQLRREMQREEAARLAALKKAQDAEEAAMREETEEICRHLRAQSAAHMVEAVRYLAREVVQEWQS